MPIYANEEGAWSNMRRAANETPLLEMMRDKRYVGLSIHVTYFAQYVLYFIDLCDIDLNCINMPTINYVDSILKHELNSRFYLLLHRIIYSAWHQCF